MRETKVPPVSAHKSTTTLLGLGRGRPRPGKHGHPSAEPKPQTCHLPRPGDCWLVVASWVRAKDIMQSAREFPLAHLPPTQAAMAANRRCCAIKVFVKKLCWALWAILKALFRLAGNEEERKEKKQYLEANQS